MHTKIEMQKLSQFVFDSLDASWEKFEVSQLLSRLVNPNCSVSVFVFIGVLKADFPTLSRLIFEMEAGGWNKHTY